MYRHYGEIIASICSVLVDTEDGDRWFIRNSGKFLPKFVARFIKVKAVLETNQRQFSYERFNLYDELI